ncbi:MAG: phosphoribosylaminoimidazolesuccinocarboxamide synthase [Candidatus Methanomethyliaceae archaeon]|nr:phosphoribosylaminoimidazolesuccinocarboxamide synthase [Candidatus Methanomethyliaceae archaeon]MCX8170288.1 phosphoribosylaminoimidazolesuccinocarboxamide synthase [Candidatus Methanomethyliaceae archaeon]MDW7971343.1 phosphoribosylaminoimidazolesuccinocarboxamide synthase [Nitrososphaerota archaeon]
MSEVIGYSDLKIGKLRRGKVRDVYDLGEELLIFHTDRVSAFDVVLPTLIPHKGEYLQKLTVFWFERSKSVFPNHFISIVDNRTIRVRKAKRIDIEWIVRKYLYGSLWREYSQGKRELYGIKLPSGLRKAEELPEPILTPTTKVEKGHDEPITKHEAIELRLVDKDTWDALEEASLKLFEFYEEEAKKRGLIIPDFKLEFGFIGDELIQIDEPPTHDSARIWSLKYYKVGESQEQHCLDKEFLRECLRRMGFHGSGVAPELPKEVVKEVEKRCIGAYKVMAGEMKIEDLNLLSVDDIFK